MSSLKPSDPYQNDYDARVREAAMWPAGTCNRCNMGWWYPITLMCIAAVAIIGGLLQW